MFFLRRVSGLFKLKCAQNLLKIRYTTIKNRAFSVPLRETVIRKLHDDADNLEEQEIEHELYEDQPLFLRTVLYPNLGDPLINKINSCSSFQQVLDLINQEIDQLDYRHLTQMVLIIWDLFKVLHHIKGMRWDNNIAKMSYFDQLHKSDEFKKLLTLIQNNLDKFDVYSLSYVMLYLNKLGINHDNNLLKEITQKVLYRLLERYENNAASRFLVTVFHEHNLRSLNTVVPLVPHIFNSIDDCSTAEDLKYLTICLTNIRVFVTKDILNKYKTKVLQLMDQGCFNDADYKPMLKVMFFLHCIEWRDESLELLAKCGCLVKNNMNLFTPNEILLVFEIFTKTQHLSEIRNDLQRCITRHFLQIEELEQVPDILYTKLKLLSALATMSPSMQKNRHGAALKKLVLEEDLDANCLLCIKQILVIQKTKDRKLCEVLWDKLGSCLKNEGEGLALKLCTAYSNFNVDIHNFRHHRFERILIETLDKLSPYYDLFPSVTAHTSQFLLRYHTDRRRRERITNVICESWNQMRCLDWLKISKGLEENHCVPDRDRSRINLALDIYLLERYPRLTVREANFLFRSYIYRKLENSHMLEYLLKAFENPVGLNSATIKELVYCLKSSCRLLPSLMQNIEEYIVENRADVLAVNAEKFLYLTYYLDYHPNSFKFFDVVTDMLIRDRERLTGLTYLQAALSLCHFNRLPNSFIKDIFNVSFLEKLDEELANCYSKDRYPVRVRNNMLQLNRAVCLDYPEAGVPWFHQKYVEEEQRKSAKNTTKDYIFEAAVYENLLEIFRIPDLVQKDVTAAYGYHINLTVDVTNNGSSRKVAILLTDANAYTRYTVQLRGEYAMKIRHLEMLGYDVAVVNRTEFMALKDSKSRTEFLKSLIWKQGLQKEASKR